MDNIFLKNQASETLDSFLSYSEGGRDNLGNTIPVMVYRMLEYSLKLELVDSGNLKITNLDRLFFTKNGEFTI